MKLLEKIFLLCITLCFVLRIFFVPGFIAFSFFSLFTTALLYLTAGFWLFNYKDKKSGVIQNNIGLSIGSGIVFFIALIGIAFKLMFWPGAFVFLALSCLLLVGLLIAGIMLHQNSKGRKKYYKLLIIRYASVLVFCITLIFFNGNNIYRFFHRNDPVLIQKWEYMRSNPDDIKANEDFYNYLNSPK
ncbi:MAG: hypothetical protein Q8M29_15720 [Bacteroidota bacterium]|nr:hypothetical protein [Bacteroidota bacterium]